MTLRYLRESDRPFFPYGVGGQSSSATHQSASEYGTRITPEFTEAGSVKASVRGIGIMAAKEAKEIGGEQQPKQRDLPSRLAELEAENERLRIIADFTYDWETWHAPDGTCLYCSPSCQRITGHSAAEFLSVPRLLKDIVHPAERQGVAEHLDHFESEASPKTLTFQIVASDGTIRWIEHVCQPVYDSAGVFRGRRASNRDVTDRKDFEELLRRSLARWETMLKALPVGVAIAENTDGLRIRMNQVLAEMLGMTVDQNASLAVPEGRAAYLAFQGTREMRVEELPMQQAIRDVTVTDMEMDVVRADGKRLKLLAAAVPLRDINGHCQGAVGTFLDITEQRRTAELLKEANNSLEQRIENRTRELSRINSQLREEIEYRRQAEKTLRESEQRLSTIFRVSPVGIGISSGLNGPFVDVNDAFCQMFGYSREEILGRTSLELGLWPRPEERAKMLRLLRDQGRVQRIESQFRRKSGEIGDILISADLIELDGQQHLLGILTDITDRKRADALLRQTIENLDRSNKDLAQFAYVTSHDLKEPLRMVTGFTSLLQDHCRGKLDAQSEQYISFASNAASRMQQLIDDLLAYSRAGRGEATATDVESVVDDVLKNLTIGIRESGAVITRGPLPTIAANSIDLTQVFQNLIANAIKFQEKRRPEIHIAARQQADGWLFTVRDNGIGIDPRFADRLFEVFQRLHTADEYPGTGIGLAICKKIVERYGGRIWVESELTKGASFYFVIPDRGKNEAAISPRLDPTQGE